jgi:hypothetical protein
MAKNQNKLSDTKLSPEATKGVRLFHVSQKENRESIESKGLKPIKPWDDEPAGVYVSSDARADYGDDVYEITPKPGTPIHQDTGEFSGSMFIPKKIPTSDFKRVGHFYRTPEGHPEIHWHPEEECPKG